MNYITIKKCSSRIRIIVKIKYINTGDSRRLFAKRVNVNWTQPSANIENMESRALILI